jgi:hypothetical protein
MNWGRTSGMLHTMNWGRTSGMLHTMNWGRTSGMLHTMNWSRTSGISLSHFNQKPMIYSNKVSYILCFVDLINVISFYIFIIKVQKSTLIS